MLIPTRGRNPLTGGRRITPWGDRLDAVPLRSEATAPRGGSALRRRLNRLGCGEFVELLPDPVEEHRLYLRRSVREHRQAVHALRHRRRIAPAAAAAEELRPRLGLRLRDDPV